MFRPNIFGPSRARGVRKATRKAAKKVPVPQESSDDEGQDDDEEGPFGYRHDGF